MRGRGGGEGDGLAVEALDCGGGFGSWSDGLEGVDGEGVEEFVSKYEGGFGRVCEWVIV